MPTPLIIIALIVLSYPVVASLALRAAGPTRMAFADGVRLLLQDPSVSEDHKVFLSSMADDLFDWKFMAWASIIFPFVAVSRKDKTELSETDRDFFCRRDVQNIMDLHMRSVMAASPAFTVLFIIVGIITMLCVIAFVGLSIISMIWADTVKQVSPNVGRGIIVNHNHKH